MKVELSLHASKLKNVAGAFKGISDPFAVATLLPNSIGEKPKILGRTEVVKNSLSPRWVKAIQVDYELGTPCKIAISVYDEVRKSENKPMGSVVFEIGEIMGTRGNTKAKQMKSGGTLFASVRKSQGSGTLRLKMKGTKLKNVEGFLRKSDPFFELSRKVNNAGGLTWDNVFRSKVIKNNLDPVWETEVVDLRVLCDGDLDKPILITVFDYESKGENVSMGKFETTVSSLIEAAPNPGNSFELQKKGKNVGSLSVIKADVYGVTTGTENMTAQVAAMSVALPSGPPAPSAPHALAPATRYNFVDYISGGCELNVVVAIDFTGSNGDPRMPGTLHYMNPDGSTNDYEKAIFAVLNTLQDYDHDKMFPVYGFGAKYGGIVRHCFQCGPQPEVYGAEGVAEAYQQVFKSGLVMSGPTVVTDVIKVSAAKAISSLEAATQRGAQSYTILLVLTDGAVSDIPATAAVLDRVSVDAPLSIVIVGIGNDDFSSMKFLGDYSSYHPGKRDIAQFVQFNKHGHDCTALTHETLRKIPNQLVGYFQSKGLAPLPLQERPDKDIVAEPQEEEIDLSLNITDDEIVVERCNNFVSGYNAHR